jgi:hypothetical protein
MDSENEIIKFNRKSNGEKSNKLEHFKEHTP